ncbi:hypothetical protein [Hafnia alvei]|uniref:hypothetical protein n=1 Tax=Hafnia alvei TaxID=569 RepID=UPI0010344428|nr:hypothetical protein [Hafnia alvei]TBM08658.1 hypothetical protein EYY84_19880 [Hafnia alvei]
MNRILMLVLSLICFTAAAQKSTQPVHPWMPLSPLGNGYFVYGDTSSIGVTNNIISMLVQFYPTMDDKQKEVYFGKLAIPVKTCTEKQGAGKLLELNGNFIRELKYVEGGISAGDGTITNACLLFEQKQEAEKIGTNK